MYSGDWPDGAGLFPSVRNAFRAESDILSPATTPVFRDPSPFPKASQTPASELDTIWRASVTMDWRWASSRKLSA
jgi:hypothetical protein